MHALTDLCALLLRSLPPKISIGSTFLLFEKFHGHRLGSYTFSAPLHGAVVEATHPKNAPLAHLEASQYKNSRVSTALTRGRKPTISFQSLASVTHGHGSQSLYWRCAKQKDRAKIFHCFKLENKASSRSAPPTTSVARKPTNKTKKKIERAEHFAALAAVKSWSQCACTHYWKFAKYVARLPSHRWVKRVLAWSPPGPRNSGRPPNSWDHKLTSYCRYRNCGHWVDAAEDQQLWDSHLDDFINFCRR